MWNSQETFAEGPLPTCLLWVQAKLAPERLDLAPHAAQIEQTGRVEETNEELQPYIVKSEIACKK